MFTFKTVFTLAASRYGKLLLLSFLLTSGAQAADNSVFVSGKWLKNHQSEVKLIDMSDKANFQKFHLDGAIWVSYNWLIKPQNGLALSGGADYMANVLSQLGFTNDDHIVIYDDMGGLASSRLYWELKKLNHKNVNILDGGIVSWILAGNKVTQTPPQRPQKTNYKVPAKTSTDSLTANKAEVLAAIKDPETVLIDSRSKEEYEGSAKEKRSGHIPSALWFDWSKAVNIQEGFTQYSDEELLHALTAKSVHDLKQPIIVYCNTAHRASRSFTMLKSLGFENVKLYDGSIQEYSIDQSLPLKLGMQP
ncbi:sulfurtransferase [Thiomicrorhabdus immobilis]|uniref:Sulfurtransferase n=1 Tax=Thiomicrorhabdus immobilis TaxID=2791037 RepID=A0ABN6CW40_9GAMM|nr:rhodanese-like domain-containing protein [Thiomicrorhabdus immobilis]BCN93215.1 sulfurtransferase [Thiomicrorhabdus immobilis]